MGKDGSQVGGESLRPAQNPQDLRAPGPHHHDQTTPRVTPPQGVGITDICSVTGAMSRQAIDSRKQRQVAMVSGMS